MSSLSDWLSSNKNDSIVEEKSIYRNDYKANVRSVLTKVALGEGDAGIVYVSNVIASPKTPVKRLTIPDTLNIIASYPIAPVSDSKHADLAKKFVAYVFAGDSRLILARYGFTLPK